MDISKTFDIMDHDLLIAKLNAYSFTKESLRLTKGYPSNCWQKKKLKQVLAVGQTCFQDYQHDSMLAFEWFESNCLNPLSANPTKWSNTFKQCVSNLPREFNTDVFL